MIRRMLVPITRPTGRGVVLRWVLRITGALWRDTNQVQRSEDAVAEEQRAYQQHG
jgi:hypothetical protein